MSTEDNTPPVTTPPESHTLAYVLVGGGLVTAGIAYAAYKAAQVAAPYALAYAAPNALPYYEAVRAAQTPEARRAAMLKAAQELAPLALGVPEDERVTVRRLVEPAAAKKTVAAQSPERAVHWQLLKDEEANTPPALVRPSARERLAKRDTLPIIENWRRVASVYQDRDEIQGQVYGKPGVVDGKSITIFPVSVQNGIAKTNRSEYALGTELKSDL